MWQMSDVSADWLQGKHIYLGEERIATKYSSEGNVNTETERAYIYYYHSDHLGSAQTVTNYRGQEHERLEYTPYGELWIDWQSDLAPEDKTPFRFTGKELDTETGLYYYGARYLEPKTSRWISADPAVSDYLPSAPVNDEARKHNQNLPGQGGVFNYVNMQVYHYAGNNPVKYVDPDGEVNVPIVAKYLMNAENTTWSGEKLFNTDISIKEHGCLLTDIANLATTIGKNLNPLDMNTDSYLNKNGEVVWGNVAKGLQLSLVADGKGLLPSITFARNEADKKNNYYTLAKVNYNGTSCTHWVGIKGAMLVDTPDGKGKLYYEIAPTSKNDTPETSTVRRDQGWIKIDDKVYVPADKVTGYKIYSKPIDD